VAGCVQWRSIQSRDMASGKIAMNCLLSGRKKCDAVRDGERARRRCLDSASSEKDDVASKNGRSS
jgi:hypothetical protein